MRVHLRVSPERESAENWCWHVLRSPTLRRYDGLRVALFVSLKLALARINHSLRLVHDEHACSLRDARGFTLGWLFIVHLSYYWTSMIVLMSLSNSVWT